MMPTHRSAAVVALITAVLLVTVSVPSGADPAPPSPSRALVAWASGAPDPGAVYEALLRNPDKTPVEFDERLRWADSDGTLQVMVSLTERNAEIEDFVAAHTVDLHWYGNDPRFLARVTPTQLVGLLGSTSVLFVEPDFPIANFMSDSSADVRARTASNSGVYSFDASSGPMGSLVSNVPGLTAEEVTGAGVRVAITDSGIDKTHRDFGGWDCPAGPYQPCDSRIVKAVTTEQLVGGFEPSDALPLPTTEAASGHGTHVAGTIAGNGYYSRQNGPDAPRYGGDGYVIGIAPNAELISVKNGDSQWAGLSTNALQWQLDSAAELGIKVSSNSWGCIGGCTFNGNSVLGQVFRDLYNAGVVVAFAVGNDGGGANGAAFSGYAQSPYVLGVANYNDANDQLSSSSSRGSSAAAMYDATTWTPESEPVNGTRRPDVGAPGTSIWSAASLTGGTASLVPRVSIGDVDAGSGPTVEYRSMSGTSMATPHVAGAVALMTSACPAARPLDKMRAIMAGADGDRVLKTGGGSVAEPFETGYGGLDVRASLDWLLNLSVCGGSGNPEPDPTPTPTPSPTSSPEPPPSAEFPAPEDATVVDPFGDANYVNDQDTGENTGVSVDNLTGPPDAYDSADIGTVWFSNTSTTVTAHVQTEAKLPGSEGLFFRVRVDPGDGSRCLWFQGETAGDGNLGGNAATLRDTCSSAVPTSTGTISFSDGPDGTGIMSLTFPMSAHPALAAGKVLATPAAHVRNYAGVVTAPQIDSTLDGVDFTISGAPDPDPTPSPTPTTSPTPEPSPTAGGARGSYPSPPNDPFFGEDPSDPLDFDPTQWALRKIQGPEAWQTGATGYGIGVAVLDSGVDLQHEDLQCTGKIDVRAGSDIVANDSNPDDENGHGTHVAGIIGACTNNGTGMSGVAPDSTIVPVRVLDEDGSGNDNQLIAGLDKAVASGAHVINMSLGYIPGKEIINNVAPIDAAIQRAQAAGVVVIAAAGNDSFPLCEYPALAEDVICVGATDPRDAKSWYSVFPNKLDNEDGIGPSVVAPGGTEPVFCDVTAESVLSLYPAELDNCDEGLDGYRTLNGTSMATPHVAGVAALVYDRLGGQRSAENARAVIDTLIGSTDDLGAPGYDPVFGYGRVNALKAVQAVDAPAVTSLAFTETSSVAGQFSDETAFSARLTAAPGTAVEGAEVAFTLTGADSERTFSTTTGPDGIATVTPLLTEAPGAYQLTVRYEGDADNAPAADSMGYVVEKEDTTISFEASSKGGSSKLEAKLRDADAPATGLQGLPVDFYAGDEYLGTATTDRKGNAIFTTSEIHAAYEARFPGDDYYLPASAGD